MAWTWTIPTARWNSVSSWLVFARASQALGALLTTALNGALLMYILRSKDGTVPQTVVALELMASMALIYSVIVLLALHYDRRRRREPTMKTIATFITCDVLCIGLMIATITILARSGVPLSCRGFATWDKDDGSDNYGDRRRGFSLRSDDDDDDDEHGEHDEYKPETTENMLDRYCSVERTFYCLVIALIYFYMASIILSVLRIFERRYAKNSQLNDLLETAEDSRDVHQLEYMRSKAHRPESIIDIEDPASPIRGAVPAGIASSSSLPTSRIISANSRSHPTSPTPAVSVSTLPTIPRQGPSIHPTYPVSPITPPAGSPITSPVNQNKPMDGLGVYQDPLAHTAEAAMVTDGFRHSSVSEFVSLPPYSPGPSRRFMAGHGDENNEMRLSEYVKGQTQAQTMKDAGGGF